ncbi:MAG: 4-(cytidine 5'-diphospho)-2-C-methyl-D-erythritol kinase, partial [Spirochaetales bacterium]|nr:4-(cytidine 5'-diphospho)-2-C-methyl-D-erythritol kinase [Spirochaetales bacterium]
MDNLKILAPAKINLHLQITSKREDGYHNLISLFQMVSLYDELYIETIKSNEIRVVGDFDCYLEDNLIYKAANSLEKNCNIKSGVFINCKKNIPSGAGLGGGSSDAAATLIGIRSLLKLDISDEELKARALKIGSDVPFFLGEATAVAGGRGEVLIPIKTRKDLLLLIIDTGIYSSTKEAFSTFKFSNNRNILTIEEITAAFLNKHPSDWPFSNSFTPYLYRKNSIFREIIKLLDDNGSDYSSITGT